MLLRLVLALAPLTTAGEADAAAAAPAGARAAPAYDFHPSSAALTSACVASRDKAEERLKGLAAVLPASATFHDTFVSFSDIVSDLSEETAVPMFLGQVSTDKEVREAGIACDTLVSQFLVGVFAREDLYRTLKATADKGERLEGEDGRLVEKTLLDFKRNGLGLPEDKRVRVRALKQKLVELQNDFAKRLAEEHETLLFTKAQLAGLPEDFVARLSSETGGFRVSLDYPDYFPFMDNAKDPEARRQLESRFDSRGGEANDKLLAEALRLRAEVASLLGYPDYAAYAVEDRMAKTSEAVSAFLKRLRGRLEPKGKEELALLLGLKKRELGAKSDGILHAWDWRYYHNQLMKTRYSVDDQKIKEYFPLEQVTGGLLEVYQTVLGLKFKPVEPARAWHEDVRLFEVSDGSGGEPIGYFYMDLFPRLGKYKHAAAFTLASGRLLPDGSYRKPVSAIVANFNKPAAEAPSLLTHKEVETFFHEFGHIMHQVLTKARYERFSGSNVAQDFVEAPSQMFQNWVWQEGVLRRLSGHYKDTRRKLPGWLLKKMVAAKNVDSGLKYLRQDFLASVDMAYHAGSVPDVNATYARLMEEISLVPMTPGTRPEASFGHLMGGYEAGYYGYLWSEVYAQDMFSLFEKRGVLDPALGREYRAKVLEPGSSVEEARSLRSFLGREPGEEAFLRSIGL